MFTPPAQIVASLLPPLHKSVRREAGTGLSVRFLLGRRAFGRAFIQSGRYLAAEGSAILRHLYIGLRILVTAMSVSMVLGLRVSRDLTQPGYFDPVEPY
jgi:hypothetical protein